MNLIFAAILGTATVVLGAARWVLAQDPTPGILDVGAWVSGFGGLGLLAWGYLSDRIKTRADLERVIKERDTAEQLRNEALARERETLERVIPLVVASNDLVARMAARHLGGDGER